VDFYFGKGSIGASRKKHSKENSNKKGIGKDGG
jgi:hypothetical protein